MVLFTKISIVSTFHFDGFVMYTCTEGGILIVTGEDTKGEKSSVFVVSHNKRLRFFVPGYLFGFSQPLFPLPNNHPKVHPICCREQVHTSVVVITDKQMSLPICYNSTGIHITLYPGRFS